MSGTLQKGRREIILLLKAGFLFEQNQLLQLNIKKSVLSKEILHRKQFFKYGLLHEIQLNSGMTDFVDEKGKWYALIMCLNWSTVV